MTRFIMLFTALLFNQSSYATDEKVLLELVCGASQAQYPKNSRTEDVNIKVYREVGGFSGAVTVRIGHRYFHPVVQFSENKIYANEYDQSDMGDSSLVISELSLVKKGKIWTGTYYNFSGQTTTLKLYCTKAAKLIINRK